LNVYPKPKRAKHKHHGNFIKHRAIKGSKVHAFQQHVQLHHQTQLSVHQARRALEEQKGDVNTELAQYRLLESLLAKLKEQDDEGVYEVEFQDETETKKSVKRVLVSWGWVKDRWPEFRPVVSIDGTFTQTVTMKSTLLTAVVMSANNNIVPLMLGVVDVENEQNWVWFLERLLQRFPGINVVISDAMKGIFSHSVKTVLTHNGVFQLRCYWHM